VLHCSVAVAIGEIATRLPQGLEQSLIDDAVDQWPTSLHACVRANAGHFEHTL